MAELSNAQIHCALDYADQTHLADGADREAGEVRPLRAGFRRVDLAERRHPQGHVVVHLIHLKDAGQLGRGERDGAVHGQVQQVGQHEQLAGVLVLVQPQGVGDEPHERRVEAEGQRGLREQQERESSWDPAPKKATALLTSRSQRTEPGQLTLTNTPMLLKTRLTVLPPSWKRTGSCLAEAERRRDALSGRAITDQGCASSVGPRVRHRVTSGLTGQRALKRDDFADPAIAEVCHGVPKSGAGGDGVDDRYLGLG